MLQAIYKMSGESESLEKAVTTVNELFVHLDVNKDNKISKDEFREGAKKSEAIAVLFQLTNIKLKPSAS